MHFSLESRRKRLLLSIEQRKGARGSSSRAKASPEKRMLIALFELGISWMRQCFSRPERKRGGSS